MIPTVTERERNALMVALRLRYGVPDPCACWVCRHVSYKGKAIFCEKHKTSLADNCGVCPEYGDTREPEDPAQ